MRSCAQSEEKRDSPEAAVQHQYMYTTRSHLKIIEACFDLCAFVMLGSVAGSVVRSGAWVAKFGIRDVLYEFVDVLCTRIVIDILMVF